MLVMAGRLTVGDDDAGAAEQIVKLLLGGDLY
jgi:hypothetical protein